MKKFKVKENKWISTHEKMLNLIHKKIKLKLS